MSAGDAPAGPPPGPQEDERAQSPEQAQQRGQAQEAADEREQAQSLSRIEQGGIPLAAERRMQATAAGALPFSSTLSVGEYALAAKLGLRPVGQVLGASVHQVGYQYLPEVASWGGEVMGELQVVSQAWDQARRLALDRMTEEARQAGADAVVGVSVKRGAHDWAEGAVDYMVSGTAVRLPNSDGGRWPVLSDLSGQEYWQLYQAGYEPAGLVVATSVFFVSPSSGMQWQRWATTYQNQELTEFTQGFYAAREIVLGRLSSQADAGKADGIVGVHIDQHAAEQSFRVGGYGGGYGGYGQRGGKDERHGLVITLHAMGTAIRSQASVPLYPPEPAIDLTT